MFNTGWMGGFQPFLEGGGSQGILAYRLGYISFFWQDIVTS